MENLSDTYDDLAALAWQIDLGADEAIGEEPVDRFALEKAAPKMPAAVVPDGTSPAKAAPTPPARLEEPEVDVAGLARSAATAATNLENLEAAIAGFEHCDLRKGARKTVFATGTADARVMFIGDIPTREEDREGTPFVGAEGRLLDRMLAAISMGRSKDENTEPAYLATVSPWRTPMDRDLDAIEMATVAAFMEKHIALADPEVIVLMGNTACRVLLDISGVARARGQWHKVFNKPALATYHPSFLLRTPAAKRQAWEDLLTLQARMNAKDTDLK